MSVFRNFVIRSASVPELRLRVNQESAVGTLLSRPDCSGGNFVVPRAGQAYDARD